MATNDKDEKAKVSYKAFEAKILLKNNLVINKKPKLLDSYLDKVARVVGVQRNKTNTEQDF